MRQYFTIITLLLFAGNNADAFAQQKKALFVILDGIPAEVLENAYTPHLDSISGEGGYTRAYVGGLKGGYSETPTISAVGYNSLLTGTWVNKHNVKGNSIRHPNYNYWTIFRHFKEAYPNKKTAIYSTWLDNRTKLIGENLPETGHLQLDYHFDGLELDTLTFPHDSMSLYIHKIDKLVASQASKEIMEKAPDLTWVYLEYTDDIGHRFGFGEQMNNAVREADRQVGLLWEAISYRISTFGEDWMIIVTTDHGRGEGGFHHGGQTDEERTTWIASNKKFNEHFKGTPAVVDIFPTLAQFLDISIPKNKAMELDGVSMLGNAFASGLKGKLVGKELELTWTPYQTNSTANVWVSSTNQFRYGSTDQYWLLGEVNLENGQARFDCGDYTFENLKVVLELPHGYLNTWVRVPEKGGKP